MGWRLASALRTRQGDIVVKEHWAQSGFANTDLDQQLRQHGITHVIVVGLLANTCIVSTARYAMELGFNVTLVRDATAAFTREMMHAAHVLNGPTYAHAILNTRELIEALEGREASCLYKTSITCVAPTCALVHGGGRGKGAPIPRC